MMKTLARTLLLIAAGILWNGLVHAEGGSCPPGMYPPSSSGTGGVSACYPIPGYENHQQAPQPQPPAPQWENQWGAVAIDGTNGVLGTAHGTQGQGAIERAAMADCQTKGGATCKLDSSYRNSCVAVITGDDTHNSGTNPSLNVAIEKGMKECVASGDKNCRAYYTNCSLPVRIR